MVIKIKLPEGSSDMLDKKKAKQAYKQTPPAAGIYQVKNLANGKLLVGSAQNVQGVLNRIEFQLRNGGCPYPLLQQDWDTYGEGQFLFEMIDTLKPSGIPGADLAADLKVLEQMWLQKLQPYGEHGYNRLRV